MRACRIPTNKSIEQALSGPVGHLAFIKRLPELGPFGRFPCDAHEFLLALLEDLDAFKGEFKTTLRCEGCCTEVRVEETLITSVCEEDDLCKLLTEHTPRVPYRCDCGKQFEASTVFYAGEVIILHFVCVVTFPFLQKIEIRGMHMVGVICYTGYHYVCVVRGERGWETHDDAFVYSGISRARPYMAFFAYK